MKFGATWALASALVSGDIYLRIHVPGLAVVAYRGLKLPVKKICSFEVITRCQVCALIIRSLDISFSLSSNVPLNRYSSGVLFNPKEVWLGFEANSCDVNRKNRTINVRFWSFYVSDCCLKRICVNYLLGREGLVARPNEVSAL